MYVHTCNIEMITHGISLGMTAIPITIIRPFQLWDSVKAVSLSTKRTAPLFVYVKGGSSPPQGIVTLFCPP